MNDRTLRISNYKPEDVKKLKALRSRARPGLGTSCMHPVDEILRDLHRPNHCPERDLFLAELENTIAGYMDVIREHVIKRAVLNYLVRPGEQFGYVFRELLRHCVKRSEDLGLLYIHINVPEPDITTREMLADEGFKFVKRYTEMVINIGGRDIGSEILSGTCLRNLEKGEEDRLRDIQNKAFMGTWGFNPNSLEDIIHRMKQADTSPEDVILCLQGHKPVAYCWTVLCQGSRDRRENRARIHMLGVAPEFRGKGMGRAILLAGLRHLKNKGFDCVELTCDTENLVALSLYRKIGFRGHSASLWYEKKTGQPS
ncbi:MAG: GNAT family N-acetyltransferase [Deltaproteobacteria bacterium]|nr:GNAT family N-acetyltransferase [Deltaproteobacteria bacterium]